MQSILYFRAWDLTTLMVQCKYSFTNPFDILRKKEIAYKMSRQTFRKNHISFLYLGRHFPNLIFHRPFFLEFQQSWQGEKLLLKTPFHLQSSPLRSNWKIHCQPRYIFFQLLHVFFLNICFKCAFCDKIVSYALLVIKYLQ